MKYRLKPDTLTYACAGVGTACLLLRLWLLCDADGKGLLPHVHAGSILSWLLAGLAAAGLILLCIHDRRRYRAGREFLNTLGSGICALGFGIAAWCLLTGSSTILAVVCGILAIVSALCVGADALLQHQQRWVPALVYFPAIVFFLVFVLLQYQSWSGEPELQRYVFALLAAIFLMLTFYHRAAMAARAVGGKAYLYYSRAALLFCLGAIPGSSFAGFYCCMAVCILLDGCTPRKDA